MFSPKSVTDGTNKEEGGQTTRHKRKFSGNQPFTPKVWTVCKSFFLRLFDKCVFRIKTSSYKIEYKCSKAKPILINIATIYK